MRKEIKGRGNKPKYDQFYMNEHYVCTGCSGVSDKAGACQTEGCAKKGQPLTGCACEDNMHEGAKTRAEDEEMDEDEEDE